MQRGENFYLTLRVILQVKEKSFEIFFVKYLRLGPRVSSICVIFRSFPINSREISWKFFARRIRGRWIQIWHRKVAQDYLVLRALILNIIFKSFPTSLRDSVENFFFGGFRSHSLQYYIGNCPTSTWCPGPWVSTSSSGALLYIWGKPVENFFPGVFQFAD